MLTTRLIPTAAFAATVLVAALAPTLAQADGNGKITVIFTRHAEKMTTTKVLGDATTTYELEYVSEMPMRDEFTTGMPGVDDDSTANNPANSKGDNLDEVCGESKCAEELSDLGRLRADLLVSYLNKGGIIDKLDAVYSSHKFRTYQTVEPSATAAGLDVVQLPVDGTELQPEGTGPSECPTLEAIVAAEPGDTLLIAGHSGTLYDIMGDGVKNCGAGMGLGLDTSDNDAFPKDEDDKVRDFGDLWTVEIKNGEAKLKDRVNLQPTRLRVVSTAK